MADLLGAIRERAELRADALRDRRRRAAPRNARIRRALLQPRHLVLAVVVLLASVAALFIGQSLGRDSTTRPPGLGAAEVDGGRLALAGWSGWLPAKTPRWIDRLVPGAVATKPLLLDGITVVIGDVRDGGVPRLLALVRSADRNGSELAAGDLHVRMYSGGLVGHTPLAATLILVPTQAGASAAICVADRRKSTEASGQCLSQLPTWLTLRSSEPTSASPDATSAAPLAVVLRRLDRVRGANVPALAAEATSGRQAQAAQRLSVAYASAARAVGAASFTTLAATSAASLVAGLSAGAHGYQALATAAKGHSPSGFGKARGQVVAAEAAIARSLRQLSALGYRR